MYTFWEFVMCCDGIAYCDWRNLDKYKFTHSHIGLSNSIRGKVPSGILPTKALGPFGPSNSQFLIVKTSNGNRLICDVG